MQYLDSEIGGESMQLQRGEAAFDEDDFSSNLSSMSLSPGRKDSGGRPGGGPQSASSAAAPKGNGAQTFLASVRATSSRASPAKSVRSQGGRSYVWDDWGNDDGLGGGAGGAGGASTVSQLTGDEFGGGGGDTATYFSLRADPNSHSHYGGGDGGASERDGFAGRSSPQRSLASTAGAGSSASLQRVVGDLKVKIDALKGQLGDKQARVRELQSELARLATAKARRVQKFRSAGEAQLAAQREELGAALKKTSDFVEKLASDVKQLTIKRDGLKDKQGRLAAQRESALQLLQDEVARKMARARRQWEAEERAVFEKALKGKEEALKKAAADSFGPALDKLVIEGKEAVRARQDECTKRLERLKRELSAELSSKIAEARESLRDQIKADDEKTRRAGERQLQDALRRHSEETEALKLKFQRERRLAEETAERTRRIDAETSLEGMREIRRAESQQAMELMASQQRELAQVVASHAEEIKAVKQSLAAAETELQQRVTKELQASSSQQRDKAKAAFLSKLGAETEKVVSKLREDALQERKAVRDRIEAELGDLRLAAQHRLDAVQAAETRCVGLFFFSLYLSSPIALALLLAIFLPSPLPPTHPHPSSPLPHRRALERVASLRGETEALRREKASLDEEHAAKAPALAAVRQQLTALRLELAGVKQEGEALEQRYGEERGRRRGKFAREEERLRAELADAEEALARQEVRAANRREDARAMYAVSAAVLCCALLCCAVRLSPFAKSLPRSPSPTPSFPSLLIQPHPPPYTPTPTARRAT